MSSEPHFPLAPRLPALQHTAPWTEMEVLRRGAALLWELDEPQVPSGQRLPQTSQAPANPRSLGWLPGLHSRDGCPGQQRLPQERRPGSESRVWSCGVILGAQLKVNETPCGRQQEAALPREALRAGLCRRCRLPSGWGCGCPAADLNTPQATPWQPFGSRGQREDPKPPCLPRGTSPTLAQQPGTGEERQPLLARCLPGGPGEGQALGEVAPCACAGMGSQQGHGPWSGVSGCPGT